MPRNAAFRFIRRASWQIPGSARHPLSQPVSPSGSSARRRQCIARLQATSPRGVRACIRRVAGCATSTSFASHASTEAGLELTLHLDHPMGSHQWRDGPSTHLEETMSRVFRRGLVFGLIACTAASVYAPDVAEAQTSLKVIVFPT